MMLLETCLLRRFVGNPWIKARMVKHWLQMKKGAKNIIETRVMTVASHIASLGQRRTSSVIVVENRDTLRKIASSGSPCRRRKKAKGEIRRMTKGKRELRK